MVVTRLLHRHVLVVLPTILISMLAVIAVVMRQPATFTAHARLSASASVPRSQAEAVGVVDQIHAVATSRDVVAVALGKASVTRKPDMVIRSIKVAGLGSSALVDLSYTDTDSAMAQRVLAALASAVVDELNTIRAGGWAAVRNDIDDQVLSVQTQLKEMRDAGQANPKDALNQAAIVAGERRMTDLLSERDKVVAEMASTRQAAVVTTATRPGRADSRRLVARTVPAILLGLLIGLVIAGVREIMGPCVTGTAAVARRLGIPVLGSFGVGRTSGVEIGRAIRLSSRNTGISTIAVTRISGRVSPAEATSWIEQTVGSETDTGVQRICAMDDLPRDAESERVGLAVLASGTTRLQAIHDLRALVTVTGWSLLGVIGENIPKKGGRR